MKATLNPFLIALLAGMQIVLTACSKDNSNTSKQSQHSAEDAHANENAASQPNRVSISPAVRKNLGITFVQVERRRIQSTLRVPGSFEYEPSARREYRAAVPGRIEIMVNQFDHVEPDDVLYTVDSSEWRRLQQSLTQIDSEINRLTVQLETYGPLFEAHETHEESLQHSVEVWQERLAQLESVREAGGGRNEQLTSARASLASARSELTSVHENHALLRAEQKKTSADIKAARSQFEFLIGSASVVTSIPPEQLLATIQGQQTIRPLWATINKIEVRAVEPGVVEAFGTTSGSWANEETAVLTVVQPDRLRFRGSGLQSDLGVLTAGLPASIVPPVPTSSGRAVPLNESMHGSLTLGLSAQPNERTIDLFVTPDELLPWAKPGVSAQIEIVTDENAAPELSIPLAAVQRDGLTPVIFRRSPDNPNETIRMEADLGMDDGRWVELLSGVREGDEIVLDGAFQLMLATSGSIQKGGHFHADGTFHEGED